MMSSQTTFQLLDCTLRDGCYLNDWKFETGAAMDVFRSLEKSGVHIMEVGFRSSREHFNPKKYGPWRFSDDFFLKTLFKKSKMKLAVMSDYGRVGLEDFNHSSESLIDIVRIA